MHAKAGFAGGSRLSPWQIRSFFWQSPSPLWSWHTMVGTMQSPALEPIRVGDWTVAPRLNTISRNGTSVRLEPKVMHVLLCLVEARGDVVSKEDLLRRVTRYRAYRR
jgi:DNA-binding response OmpR family regulator